MAGDWSQVVCIASGPSLTVEDCEAVRQWRDPEAGRRVIAVNRCFEIAPWADALYAMDRAFWTVYRAQVRAVFAGKLYCRHAGIAGVQRYAGMKPLQSNSGAAAIELAVHLGAKRIVLLGYDAKYQGERRHWHADHPKPLGNAGSVKKWPAHFERIAKTVRAEIVNASRDTAIKAFPVVDLESALV